MSDKDKTNGVQENQNDEIDIAKQTMSKQDQDELLEKQININKLKNVTLTDAEIHMFGDRTVLAQIAQLMSYIRHAVKNNLKSQITLKICDSENTVANAELMFDVNGCQVPDCVTQQEWWIN